MSSFFESPEFLEQAAAGRVSHNPGMADQLMQDMAPFLKAEGIDVTDPDADFTEAEFEVAMDKARERYNKQLFTPVGAHRGLAVAKLRAFAAAFAAGETTTAEEVVASLPSDPEDFAPSVAQVAGTAMSLTDDWFTDADHGPKLRGVMAPKWQKHSRAVARDILALASKGRVVESLNGLNSRHSGFHVLEGSMLAVAAAVIRLSRAEKATAEQIIDELMPLDGYPQPVAGTYDSADRAVQNAPAGAGAGVSGAGAAAGAAAGSGAGAPVGQSELPDWLGGPTVDDHSGPTADGQPGQGSQRLGGKDAH